MLTWLVGFGSGFVTGIVSTYVAIRVLLTRRGNDTLIGFARMVYADGRFDAMSAAQRGAAIKRIDSELRRLAMGESQRPDVLSLLLKLRKEAAAATKKN